MFTVNYIFLLEPLIRMKNQFIKKIDGFSQYEEFAHIVKTLSHHGQILKAYLKHNHISPKNFKNITGMSTGWTYNLFKTEAFTVQQMGVVALFLNLDPKIFGFSIDQLPIRVQGSPFQQEKSKEAKVDWKIDQIMEKFQRFEKIIEQQACTINKQCEMLESKDRIIAGLIP